jgi:hypothetical protein
LCSAGCTALAGALLESVPPSDGKFSFQVADVGPATDWYGDPKPLGQYVIATMAVTNTGNEPQSFFAQHQELTTRAAWEYAAELWRRPQ